MNETRKDRILLVDDEHHLLISLRDCLTFENFDVTTAESGEQALAVLETVTPDLIILDISMPGMGGLGFLKRIAGADGKPRFPVLVLTARSMLMDFFKTVEVDGFIAKPCDDTELLGMIRSILTRRRSLADMNVRGTRKVLLAEDDSAVAVRITRLLEEMGFTVDLASTGPELLERAASGRPDLILARELLPRLNGSAAAVLLDMMPTTSAVPMVLHAPSAEDADRLRISSAKTRCVRRCLCSVDLAAMVVAATDVLAESRPA